MPIQTEHLVILAALGFATTALILVARRLSEVLHDLFGGGPRPPSHPLVADDSRILNRRSKRRATV
jgi:hypothetical protein